MNKIVIRWSCPIERRSVSDTLEGFTISEALQRAEDLAGGAYAPQGASASATDGERLIEAVFTHGKWSRDCDEIAEESREGVRWGKPISWRQTFTAEFVDKVRNGEIFANPFVIATGVIRPDTMTESSLEFTITGQVVSSGKLIALAINGELIPRDLGGIHVPDSIGLEGKSFLIPNKKHLSKLAFASVVAQTPIKLFRQNAHRLANRGRW